MMTKKQSTQMSNEFIRCYRVVSIENDSERFQRRWKGVCSLVDNATLDDVEALIRIVFQLGLPVDDERLSHIRQTFKEADELFEMSGNDREVEVLCEAALDSLYRNMKKTGQYAAIGVVTAAADGLRNVNFQIDLEGHAKNALREMAERKRRRPNLLESISSISKINFEEAVQKYRDQQNIEGFAEAFNVAGKVIESNFKLIQKDIKKGIAEASHFIDIQDEELQMLWWLIGEQSWEFDCSFSSLTANAKPLILAKELADMTTLIPGPVSIKSLLSRAGLGSRKKLTIPDAVNECDPSWLINLGQKLSPSPITLPIHFAIIRKIETGEKEAWIPGWQASTKFDSQQKIAALSLSQLFYLERLLVSLIQE